jgi:hypothetical protein
MAQKKFERIIKKLNNPITIVSAIVIMSSIAIIPFMLVAPFVALSGYQSAMNAMQSGIRNILIFDLLLVGINIVILTW